MCDKKYSYSFNEEEFHGDFSSRELAIEVAENDSDDEYQQSKIIYTAENVSHKPSTYLDVDTLIESIEESFACNELGMVEEEIIDIDDREKLQETIADALDEFCTIRHFTVKDIQSHYINQS